MKNLLVLSIAAGMVILLCSAPATAQDEPISPSIIRTGVYHGLTPPLKDLPVITEDEFQQMLSEADNKKFNKEFRERFFPYAASALPLGPDPVWQKEMGETPGTRETTLMFEGQTSPYYPPDANGTAGYNHYMQTINCVYAIYDKITGDLVAGPTFMNQLFSGVTGSECNSGDPIVIYDEQADRWVAVEMSICGPNDYMLIAISETSDPTGSWHRYSFDVDDMPDYPKIGVWQDGYYMGTNNGLGDDIYVFERSKMLDGDLDPQMVGFNNDWRPVTLDGFHCVLPLDNDGPFAPDNSPGLFITINDDAVGGGSDQLWIYELNVNWSSLESSTFDRVKLLEVPPFDSNFGQTSNAIKQPVPGKSLDAIPNLLMHRAQYRNFGTYEAIVCCHTVDVDATDHAGIRWYDLRRESGDWFIRQSGTYAPDAHSRWMGSIALNGSHELGLGYSISSSSEYPGIRYTGQSAEEYAIGSGNMDIVESTIHIGSYSQRVTSRWGDYSNMAIDPVDDHTFWFTSEYIGPNESRRTKIASFELSELTFAANFSGTPTQVCTGSSVSFTDESLGFPTSWDWSFTGGTPGTSIDQNPTIIYHTPGIYSVTLTVSDGSTTESITKTDYINVKNIIADFSGTPTSVAVGETVTFTDNSTCNPTDWAWSFPGGDPVSHNGQVPPDIVYNTANIYDVSLTVSNESGDTDTKTITDYITADFQYCFSNGNAVEEWIEYIGIPVHQSNISGSSGEAGYQDFTDLTFYFEAGGSYSIQMEPGFNPRSRFEYWRVWIDFNHDGDFLDANEEVLAADKKKGFFSKTISIPSGLDVTTRMRFSMKRGSAATPCEVFDAGEVEDYTANIIPPPPQPPVADFMADKTNIGIDETVQFTDLTTNNPTSWSWSFTGGLPLSSTQQNPSVTYNAIGSFDVTLNATNAVGSDETTKTAYIVVSDNPPPTYCEPTAIDNQNDYINSITIGNTTNNSGQGTSGFTYYNSPVFVFSPGQTYLVSLTPYEPTNRNFWRIWIDFNDDSDFSDGDETLLIANNKKGTVSSSITIPSGVSGSTRMRVSMKTGGPPASCDDNFNGEVEDYNVDLGSRSPLSLSQTMDVENLVIELYPNPVSGDELHLKVSKSDSPVSIRIYNKNGKLIDNLQTGKEHLIINISEYNNGVYFVKVSDGDDVVVKKFVKIQ